MTNDELSKMIELFQDEDEGISTQESLKLINGLIDREKQLKEIIKMQKEAIDFYADKSNWSSCCHGSYEVGIDFDDHDKMKTIQRWVKYCGGKKARATQSAVNDKLKKMGVEI